MDMGVVHSVYPKHKAYMVLATGKVLQNHSTGSNPCPDYEGKNNLKQP